MTQKLFTCHRRMFHLKMKRKILCRFSVLHKYLSSFWYQFLAFWITKSIKYRQLPRVIPVSAAQSPPQPADGRRSTSEIDLVSLKICLLGDNQTGKTSFLTKYVGKEKAQEGCLTKGLYQMDKTLNVRGARISYSIWEVEGDDSCSQDHIQAACKDSVAMLFMFDLTSRCTLSSVLGWYQQARKWNQTAIPVLIGTKFDDFVQLPLDLQWTIASEARAYAKLLNAAVFFSSATYNINVNKIFKFITAKLFNLPWTLQRNLTLGEPIIDY
nr:septum-promoting GTP-binding protein 1-like [Ipomoea batatas]